MRYLLLFLLLLPNTAYAHMTSSLPGANWTEVDGDPYGRARTIVVSSDILSFDGNIMSLDVASGIIKSFFNGSFQEPFNALVTSDGSSVTMSIEQSGGGDLTMQFSDGPVKLDCTPACTIGLNPGSTSSPSVNYVYIPNDTKVLTSSDTGFPVGSEHIKIGYFLVPSEAYVQSEGVYINQNWNDPLRGTDNMGHMLHMAERERRDGAYYFSGVGPNGTDQDTNSSYFDYVAADESYFKSASGVIFQMHRHAYPAKDTRVGSDDIHVVNQPSDNYAEIHKLNDITVDSKNTSLANRYFNVVFFGVANKSGEYGPVMANLPSGSYATQTGAEQDSSGFDTLTMPREFTLDSSTGFLICRMTMRYTGGTGTLTHISTLDLRGQTPTTASGGASGTTTNFADNQFTIFDEVDGTKIMDFDVGALVPTGTTVTITPPEKDLSLKDPTFNTLSVDTNATVSGDVTVIGTGKFGEIIDNGLTASSGVYTDGSKQLTSTVPTSGAVGYWDRTGARLTPATANDTVSVSKSSSSSTTVSLIVGTSMAQTGTDGAGSGFNITGLKNTMTNSMAATGNLFDGRWAEDNISMSNALTNTSAHSRTWEEIGAITEGNYGMRNVITRSGTVTSQDFTGSNYGSDYSVVDSTTYNKAGGVAAISNYGLFCQLSNTSGGATAGTMTKTNLGADLLIQGSPTNQNSTGFGVRVGVSGHDTNWGYYNNSASANNYMGRDNNKTAYGTAGVTDSYHQWDGSGLDNYSSGGLHNYQAAADTDIKLTCEGTTNSGVFNWLEDEDTFQFEDKVSMDTTLTVSGDTQTFGAVSVSTGQKFYLEGISGDTYIWYDNGKLKIVVDNVLVQEWE